MRQHYTGDWQHCGDNIAALLAIGVEVKFQQYWRYDYGWDFPRRENARWQVLRSKAELEAKSGQTKTVTERRWGWPTKERLESYCVISYRIPLAEYPLMRAKYKEYEREERARAAAEWERKKLEYYQHEERKLAEYLEKHPAAANPEGWQEDVDYMMANDPDHGEVSWTRGDNMTDINIVVINGRLTKSAEFRDVGGSLYCRFSVAVNRSRKNGDQWEDEVSYIDCEAWGSLAGRVEGKLAEYLEKHPAAENPDGHREGWEYIIEHDPERGPILIQA